MNSEINLNKIEGKFIITTEDKNVWIEGDTIDEVFVKYKELITNQETNGVQSANRS